MSVPETPTDLVRREAILESVGENGYALASAVRLLEERLRERDAQIMAILAGMQRSLVAIHGQLAAKAIPPLDPRAQGEPKGRHVAWHEYQELIPRIRETVREAIPAGATVLVASKGDDELLRLPGCTGWHFPRTEAGVYAGHYPANSAAAIAHLEALRGKGARFLLFPKTALWWLEHYQELRQHLENHYRMVRREDTCVIFALGTGASTPTLAPPSISIQHYQHLARQVRELAGCILPAKATVLVVSKGDEELLKIPGCKGWHFPQTEKGVYAGHNPADSAAAIAHLEALRAKGAEYLLLPATAYWWLVHYRDFRRHLENQYRTVTRQQHVCLIFELVGK